MERKQLIDGQLQRWWHFTAQLGLDHSRTRLVWNLAGFDTRFGLKVVDSSTGLG